MDNTQRASTTSTVANGSKRRGGSCLPWIILLLVLAGGGAATAYVAGTFLLRQKTVQEPEAAGADLAKRWRPIIDVFDSVGVDLCFEIHPGEDLHDGVTFEMFLDRLGGHKRCNINYDPSHFLLQQLDYLEFIDIYHERIKAFHVKDAEFNPTGRQGVYSGYQGWVSRAGRFRRGGARSCPARASRPP